MCVCPTCRVGCEHTDCVSRPPGSQPRSPRAREARVLLFPHLPPPPPCWRGHVWPRRPPFALADAPELAVVRGSPWGGGAGRAGGLRGRLLPQVQHAEPPGQRGLRLRVDRSAQGGEQGGTRPLEGSGLGPPTPGGQHGVLPPACCSLTLGFAKAACLSRHVVHLRQGLPAASDVSGGPWRWSR